MGIIHEEVEFSTWDGTARISVIEKEKGECVEPWLICSVEVDRFGKFSPKELRALGRWFINEGKRIGREYKSNGAPKGEQ